jgi:tetratricopeptide (TPR) repeat protein
VGRFSNLEFDGHEPPGEERSSAGQEIRDEGYYIHLGDQDHRSARFERGLRCYSRALEFNANVHAAWVGQVQMLIELGEHNEAKLWSDKALEVHRDHPELLSGKAVAWARLGDTDRSIQFSDAALSQRGTTPLVWLSRGEALMAGRQANDEHCFEKASAESRHDWFMQLRIARSCYWHRHFSRAMAWATKSMKQEPGAPFVLHVLGDCQAALGMQGSAESSYRQALSLDRDFELSRAALAAVEGQGPLARAWAALTGIFR